MAPKGPDEGGYRWVRRPSNGRMGTSAPTQGYNRFRRGRCPQRPVDNGCTPVVPLIRHGCAMPPSPLRGEGFGRSVGNAQMSMALPSSVTANAVPPSPRGRHCAGANLAFPLPGGRWSRRGRMRVGIVRCGGPRTGGWGHPPLRRVTIDFVGAAVPSGPSIPGAPPQIPLIRHGLRPCHLLPCGAKAIAVPSGALKCRWRSPHPSRLTPCHLPPGEGFFDRLGSPVGGRFPLSRGNVPKGQKG